MNNHTPSASPVTPGADAPRRWVEPALILTFWTLMAVLTAAGQVLDPRTAFLKAEVPAAGIGIAFINAYLWAALTPVLFRLSRRYPIEHANWRKRVLALLGLGVVVASAVDLLMMYLRFEVFFTGPWSKQPFNPLFGFTHLFWLDDLVVFLAVLTAGFARDYFLRLQKRHDEAVLLQAEAARFQAEASKLEVQLTKARLSALRAQLDPHFLFNTLNAVASLVGSDPRGVRRMIARLSALLRHSLEESAAAEVPLEQELQVLAQYVEIMEIRFEGRLHVETQAEPGVLEALVPNLILQPLVENAIKHGVSRLPGTEAGRVEVTARRDDELLVLTVRDNGPVLEDAAVLSSTEGLGVRNTRERLEQLYGSEHTLVLEPAPNRGVVATVTLPYHTRSDLHTTAADHHIATLDTSRAATAGAGRR